MPIIQLETHIRTSQKIAFNLSRSVDLHQISTKQTNERVIDGVIEGLMSLNDSVTWEGKHLGFTQTLSSKITSFKPYDRFTDEMTDGIFKSFKHEHIFKYIDDNKTVMIDILNYQSPFGILGRLADIIFLKTYLKRFLQKRNAIIKHYAETKLWTSILSNPQ